MSTLLVSGAASQIIDRLSKNDTAITDLSATSLVEFTSSTRVEPITAVDTRLTGYDFTTDVLKMLNSRFAGYYLAAASMVGDVGRIKTTQVLDKLNPSRSPGFTLANSILLNGSQASTDGIETLPEYNPEEQVVPELPVYSAEDNSGSYISGSKAVVDLTTVANLSVGQNVTLTIKDGGNSRDIVVGIRLIAYPTDPTTLKTILKWSEKDNSLKTRWRSMRVGELAFWRDIVFMRDLYVERKNALMKDKTGLFKTMISRVNKNILSGLISMSPSVGTISSIAVVSEETISELEDQIDGKLSDFATRQRIMNATGLMLIAVVDPVAELVTVYTYTQGLPEEYSIKQVRSASKSGGTDIADIIKLLNPTSGTRF